MSRKRWVVLALALLMIGLAWVGVLGARSGLVVRQIARSDVPLIYLAPQNQTRVPGVLIAHGFAGSKQLMLGYGHVLAHAGYGVMLWDFSGHGGSTLPQRDSLQADLQVAYEALVAQPEIDATRLALLGHSMGSGSVMTAGIQQADRFAATVAISPTGAKVTPESPRNLQLQAGSWEGGFIANAERLLDRAGGENENLAAGQGRSLVLIPKAEHITILFRQASHQAALRWLDATFGRQNSSLYIDRRMAWYGLHLLGWLLAMGAILPSFARSSPALSQISKFQVRSPIRRWGSLLVSALAASGTIPLLGGGKNLAALGGVQVGGAVALWFGIAGILWLGLLTQFPRPTLRALLLGLSVFALLWIGFGLMAQLVWLQWWLIPTRLALWPWLALGFLPWFLASGMAQQDISGGSRIVWWLGQSIALVIGIFLMLQFSPQLGFLYILLPLFPLFMALFAYVAALLNSTWGYALGCALFFGWAIAAAFPLAS
ncbi:MULTISPECIES: alpha/beta fold hydrolase [Trichocoleus]|uniref:Alpha/beta fold hydrolase n=1 Tax=Trichocoleus desertorum GB2-A4 TaxID=2933944 RepID=A0ABV0JCD3_9CYAN|nr:alpha/beta fold hydrolase [Trichocoleus sp. FACHB-46]MBD1864100.1 alpha/beta fold hydrolase [Trichocoleus sp. FACHB-46]